MPGIDEDRLAAIGAERREGDAGVGSERSAGDGHLLRVSRRLASPLADARQQAGAAPAGDRAATGRGLQLHDGDAHQQRDNDSGPEEPKLVGAAASFGARFLGRDWQTSGGALS